VVIYCGAFVAVESFRIAKEAFKEFKNEAESLQKISIYMLLP
jgi:hypothetical protein